MSYYGVRRRVKLIVDLTKYRPWAKSGILGWTCGKGKNDCFVMVDYDDDCGELETVCESLEWLGRAKMEYDYIDNLDYLVGVVERVAQLKTVTKKKLKETLATAAKAVREFQEAEYVDD
ncbi:MAG TPA: hypothetical protein ENH11_06995 [Candidatus Acetothermia bacterium]|nr:hypothetical protein [Candidatus Acetothermia bacterium]